MVTAEELVVAIKSEGVSETREDVEAIGDSMEETAEESRDAAEDLVGFSEDLAGAASAAVGGIALITGGLLSQVPILAEFASGLGAVISSIGLQIDQLLRDLGADGLTGALFGAANAIMGLEGTLGDIAGVFGLIITAASGAALGLAAWAVKVKGVIGAATALGGALKTAGSILVGLVAGISATTAALALAVAAVVGFAAAYLTNFRGVRDTTNRVLGNVIDMFLSFAGDLTEWAGNLASDAFNWGRNLIQGFINGIQSLIGRVRSFLGDLRNIAGNVGISVPTLGGIGGGGGGGGGGTGRARGAPAQNAFGGGVTLDGRRVSEDTGRYRADPGRRRGL
jgi:methyl-accepting chemotaxis protein